MWLSCLPGLLQHTQIEVLLLSPLPTIAAHRKISLPPVIVFGKVALAYIIC